MRPSALLMSLPVLVALLPVTATSAATPTCQGRPATIVGHDGTPDDDVIVTRGRGQIDAGQGDDLICVTGTNRYHHHSVDAGAGNDRVIVKTTDDVHAMLGKGDDVFRGRSGDDFVEAEGPLISGPGVPEQVEGFDRISSGDGADEVTIGLATATTSDVVDLGRGDDGLIVSGLPSPDVRPDGGAGSDFLRISPDEEGHAWELDNVTETALRDGVLQSQWDSFQRFDLTWLDAASTTFTGSDRDEVVSTGPDLRSATLGGGDDLIGLILPEDRVVEIDAGPGTDVIAAEDRFALTIDLTAGAAWDDTGSAETPDARLVGVEGAGAVAERVRLVGNAADNELDAFGCDAAAMGGPGDDRMSSTVEPDTLPCSAPEAAVFLSGGSGDDDLLGGKGPDRLVGGRGHDVADGDKGVDVCLAEVRRDCEKG